MISSNDLRPGVKIEYRDGVWQVIEAMHVKPGKGSAFVQTKLKNLETGDVLRVNFRAGERLQAAETEEIEVVYIYRDGDQYVVMDAAGNEQVELQSRDFRQNVDLLKEGLEAISVLRFREKIIRVELPITIDLEVKDTPPDERGDTSSSGGKPATLETGAVVTVPFHVNIGDKIRIDTRTRQYLARISL